MRYTNLVQAHKNLTKKHFIGKQKLAINQLHGIYIYMQFKVPPLAIIKQIRKL